MRDTRPILITPLPTSCQSRHFRSPGGFSCGCRPHTLLVRGVTKAHAARGLRTGREVSSSGGSTRAQREDGPRLAGAWLGDGSASPALLWGLPFLLHSVPLLACHHIWLDPWHLLPSFPLIPSSSPPTPAFWPSAPESHTVICGPSCRQKLQSIKI